MRDLRTIKAARVTDAATHDWFMAAGYGLDLARAGAFLVPSARVRQSVLLVVATTGADWDHVSVRLKHRCPSWEEMEQVKRLFFAEAETAVQYHVPAAEHVNADPHCLHLWRPQRCFLPRPPMGLV